MKRPLLVLSLLALSLAIFAQNADNSKGIEYYKAGLFDFAKTFFQQQTNTDANIQSQKYYYLGIIAVEEASDSAQYYFDKAVLAGQKAPWGYIGKGLLAIQAGDAVQVKAQMKLAEKYGKKDPSALVAIAEAYYAGKDKENTKKYIDKAKARDMKYSGTYITEGDFALAEEQVGEAQGKYEQAQYFNTADKIATLKIARMYIKMGRKDLALEQLNTIFASDPTNIPATIVFGEIKSSEGKYKEAIAAFQKVMQAGNAPINVYERYAQALYFNKQYNESLAQINKCIAENPSNIINHRIQAYNYYEIGQYADAQKSLEKVMEMGSEKTIVYQDYVTYGLTMTQTAPKQIAGNAKEDTTNYIEARQKIMAAFGKAIELKPEVANTYKEYAYSYYLFFDYANAVTYYEKFFEMNPDNYLTMDMYTYADASTNYAKQFLAIFSANKAKMTTEELAQNKLDFTTYVNKSVEANNKIIAKDTNIYIGYLGRAKANSLQDTYARQETGSVPGIAKADYEKAIEKMMSQNAAGNLNSSIVDAYNYLSEYYINQNDVKNTILMNQKILEIDPANANADKILTVLKAPRVAAEPKEAKKK